MYRKSLILFILTSFVFLSCEKDHRCDCLKRTGSQGESNRTLSDFSEIILENKINLVLTQGTENTIRFEAGEKLLNGIESTIKDGKLTIKNTNICNFSRSLKKTITAYLTFKKITKLFYTGAGDISTTNTLKDSLFTFYTENGAGKIQLALDVKVLVVALGTGPSDIVITGKTNDSFIYNAGNGYIHLEDLASKYTSVISNSTGDCYVWTTDLLDVTLGYSGDIYYKGTPVVRDPILKGTGKLKRI